MKTALPIIYLLLIGHLFSATAQVDDTVGKIIKTQNKGKMYFYWGWNIASYSDSDIRFKGNNYDYTIYNANAQDRITPISIDKYLYIGNITIPQTNARIGYYFHDNWNASIGLDHMKYVLNQYQTASVSGTINLAETDEGTQLFNGQYNNTDTVLYEEFTALEHTDGLNYIHLEVARVDNIGDYLAINPDLIQINITEGLGAGVLYPKTNAKVLNKERYDQFHVSGYGISLKGGINLTFFKNFFIQAELKGGFINLPNIRTTANKSDSASQHFFFVQQNITFGGVFQLFNREKKK